MVRTLPVERHAAILDKMRETDIVRVESLALELGVSVATVRRDLKQLGVQGAVNRLFGGASSVAADLSFAPRSQTNTPQKARIAEAAASLLRDGETIALDTGSTVVAVASQLRSLSDIVAVTNSVEAMLVLQSMQNLRLLLTGGIFEPVTRSLQGPMVEAFYADYKTDRFIMGAGSISLDGVRDSNVNALPGKRAALASATETIVVADSSKFKRSALARVVEWGAVTTLITDAGAPQELVEAIQRIGVKVIVA